MTNEDLKKKKVAFASFGCGKNVVELEKIISKVKEFGMKVVDEPSVANIIIINTCAFLKATRNESIECIKEFEQYKGKNLERIIITGCLTKYAIEDLSSKLKGVDLIVVPQDNNEIVSKIAESYGIKDFSCPYNNYKRVLTTPNHYAYFRIADGCDNFCSYCTIPYITGRYKSVPFEDLIIEAKNLVNSGVKELIFVAQDIATYGVDLYGKPRLVDLIREVSKLKNLKKIILIYCYPENISDDLIEEIAENPKVCKYLDIPLQHISNDVLKRMNRKNTKEKTEKLIKVLRKKIDGMCLRTTFILGFPGETEKDFNEASEFLEQYKLQQVGFFAYSREKGTVAYSLPDQVPEKIKRERVKKLAEVQYNVVIENNKKLIGKEFEVIVDEVRDGYAVARCDFQIPEVDSVTFVYGDNFKVGEFYKVKITDYKDYDLIAELV